MWTSLGKSIGDFVEERLTSPLISSFALAWTAVNYKFFVILFSKNTASEAFKLIEEVCFPDWNTRIANGFVLPLVFALIYLFVIPYPAQWVYRHWRRNLQKTDNIKQDYENAKRLTIEESREYRQRINELEIALDKSAATTRTLRTDLQASDRRASELEAELSKQTELRAEIDATKTEIKESREKITSQIEVNSKLESEASLMRERIAQLETRSAAARRSTIMENIAAFQQSIHELNSDKNLTERQKERIQDLLVQAENGDKDFVRMYRAILNILIRNDRVTHRRKISESVKSSATIPVVGSAMKANSPLTKPIASLGIGDAIARDSKPIPGAAVKQALNPISIKTVMVPRGKPPTKK